MFHAGPAGAGHPVISKVVPDGLAGRARLDDAGYTNRFKKGDLLDTMTTRGRPNRNVPDPILGWGVDLYAQRLRLRSGREM